MLEISTQMSNPASAPKILLEIESAFSGIMIRKNMFSPMFRRTLDILISVNCLALLSFLNLANGTAVSASSATIIPISSTYCVLCSYWIILAKSL